MSFKKPFRAAPVRLGPHAQAQERQEKRAAARTVAMRVAGAAALAGVAIGVALSAAANGGQQAVVRAGAPPAGAYYPGCNAARAAGVAPIYRGEPGYRPELDGDSDGIACEPHRGF